MSGRPKNAIVIVIDGLQAGMLGCYGNTWIKTPELDRLAAESFVFDQALTDGLSSIRLFDAHWTGTDALSWLPARNRHFGKPNVLHDPPHSELLCLFSANIIRGQVITDDPMVNHWASINGRCDVSLIPAAGERTVDNCEESQMATLFAAATDWLMDADEPFYLWLYSSGMNGMWDAPYDLRQQYADEEDPVPPTFVYPPNSGPLPIFDPDELLGIQQAYAGQVSLLDTCCGAFAEVLRESRFAENTLLVLLGAAGFGLGEHRAVGEDCGLGYSEIIHIPWLIRSPNDAGKSSRTSAIVQPSDLYPTLLQWFDIPPGKELLGGKSLWPLVHGEAERNRDRASFTDRDVWSLRTEKWHLRSSGGDESKSEPPKMELYVKPDDRFEVNDVSSRCPGVVTAMEQAWRDLVAVAESGRWDELPPLPAAALESVE